MKVENTKIRGCHKITLDAYGDSRGYFMEPFNNKRYQSLGLRTDFVQDNMSRSNEVGVFRGMHYQSGTSVQGKLVSCVEGEVIDYIVDIRKNSPTYMQQEAILLSEDNHVQVYVPEGCLHGFYVQKAPAKFTYKVTNYYDKEADGSVNVFSPEFNFSLPKDLMLSDKDQQAPLLSDANVDFNYQSRFLVTGVKGQLGHDVVLELQKRGYKDIYGVDIDEMDITNEAQVNEVIGRFEPDVIIHCSAYTAVDKAEENEQLAHNVNVIGTKNITEAAIKLNAKMIYISTDYVFDGTKEGIYEVTDETNPQSVYGKTKYLGEVETSKNPKHFIVRTSWVFGINGHNFIKTMLNQIGKRAEVTVVDDQIGSPTYTPDLAEMLVDMSESEKYGTYHVTNEGFCSWYQFASKIFELAESDMKVTPVTTETYLSVSPQQAKRPINSRLSKQNLIDNDFALLPTWEEALEKYLKILKGDE